MLDWSRFLSLPGADTENFEKLCRGVIHRHFGHLGSLHELKNQPGVEFYITLNRDHASLGKENDTVGWQNKWFEYQANGELKPNAKKQILHSLSKTVEHVSQVTKWILWTHKTLAKCDQKWYFDLQSNYSFALHLWNQDDLDELLSGPALDLRNTYFGELALTHEMLLDQHVKSIAPIKDRWLHDVHQQMDAERQVRQVLGEKEAWDIFESISDNLTEASDSIKSSLSRTEYFSWKNELEHFQFSCQAFIGHCKLFKDDICGNDIEYIKTILQEVDTKSKYNIHKTLTQLRTNNLPLSLTITNALAYIKDAKKLFRSAIKLLSQQLIAVVADAGGGKTQLAAELTAASQDRSSGILILGRTLKKGMGLDAIAQNFIFYQNKVDNFEALISALNSVGERLSRRLPIVIDGLNEAQDPREWKPMLESILPTLKDYPNVVLICTLRTSEKGKENFHRPNRRRHRQGRESLAQEALPTSAYKILSEGFDEVLTDKAISAYFQRYKINADPFTAPLNFFSHPLNLKIFCEVTNRKAENEIQVSYFPSTIYSLFREQVQHTATTIADMTNLNYRYRNEDIEKAIYYLGESLWENGSRTLKEDDFKNKINLPFQDWDSDIVNLLAQEGIIFRYEGEEKHKYELTPVYDLLGGFIIAEYLLGKNSNKELNEWVTEEKFTESIFEEVSNQHRLSEDILHALVVLTPKTLNRQQLWKALPELLQSGALALSYLIDKDDICLETIENYTSLIVNEGLAERDIERLLTLKYAVGHPFNGEFLNKVLLNLSVSDRDLSWTEYLRYQSSDVIGGFRAQIEKLESGSIMNPEITRLRMMFYAWHLTSTVIELRDYATELLYLLGKQDPKALFDLTIELLIVNDPYVLERLLASCYALTTVLIDSKEDKELIINFSQALYHQIFISNAPNATTHLIAREYASCTIKKVVIHHPDQTKDFDQDVFNHPFSKMPKKAWGCVEKDRDEYSILSSPFRMDFENNTIGSIVKDRSNYDYSHSGYKYARANILWRILELGWTHSQFEKVEQSIESDRNDYSRTSRSKVERYGKKYSWIAYYELVGQLSDDGKLEFRGERRFSTDIDPFFPKESGTSEIEGHKYLSDESVETKDWVVEETNPKLTEILELNKDEQDWILLDGFITEESNKLNRNFMCFITTAFISNEDLNLLKNFKDNKKKIDWPEKFTSHDIYSGELNCNELNPYYGEAFIGVEVGYETQTYEQPDVRIGDEVHIKGGTFTLDVPVTNDLGVFSTVFNYSWENSGSSTEGINQTVLSPWIVKELGLKFNPSNFTYRDQNGEIAVLILHPKGDGYSNYRDLIYLRKDLFDLLSKQSGMTFIKHILGEKRLAKTKNHGGPDSYRRFEYIMD